MENDFDLDLFLENLAEEQLFKSLSTRHQEQEAREKQVLLQYLEDIKLNREIPEFGYWDLGDRPSQAMKKPVDENGYPFVYKSDAARILDVDRKSAIFSGNGVIRVEKEKIPGSAKSPRIWIRLTDLKKYLETRDAIKASKIGKCLTDIDNFRALASQEGVKLRFLGSDYDRPEFYKNLI